MKKFFTKHDDLLTFLLTCIISAIVIYLLFTPAHAWYNNHDDSRIAPTPKDTPEVTESPIPSGLQPTLSIQPCEGNLILGGDLWVKDCITPTTTPTMEITPTAGQSATPTPVPPTDIPMPVNTPTPTLKVTLAPCTNMNCGWK